jgi:hypothetical protein
MTRPALFACFAIGACSQTVPVPDEGPARYVIHILSVAQPQRDDFVACLKEDEVPYWRKLKERRMLSTVSVFETIAVTSSEAGVPGWNFVIASQVPSGASADSLAETLVKRRTCDYMPGVEVRRTETLRTTPNSNYARATAEDDAKARELNVEFGIEYIAVKDTPETLKRYQENMSVNIGPSIGLLIRDDWTFSFVANETVKVHYSQAGMPSWNQIHISGRPSATKDGSAAAREAALRAVNPNNGGPEGVYGTLPSYRTRPRVDRARELFELAVR